VLAARRNPRQNIPEIPNTEIPNTVPHPAP
jgi:hypothetical protein